MAEKIPEIIAVIQNRTLNVMGVWSFGSSFFKKGKTVLPMVPRNIAKKAINSNGISNAMICKKEWVV
jgi:hypothetical protein